MKESSDTQHDVIVGIGARVDNESFKKSTDISREHLLQAIQGVKGVGRDLKLAAAAKKFGSNVASDFKNYIQKTFVEPAQKIETLPKELRAKGPTAQEIAAAEVSSKTRAGKKATQAANAKTGITGIVGIYAFRHATRFGQEFLKTIIQLRIENDKLTKGYSKLGNQLKTFNARVKGIKTNLGEVVSSALEPMVKLLNTLLAYVGSFTKQVSKLPTPLKEIIGALTTAAIVIPVVTGLVFILRYYMGRVNATMIVQAKAGSLLAKVWVNYGKTIVNVMSYLALAIIMTMAIVNLLKKTEESAKDAGKGLASFDDVNVLQQGEGGIGQELQDSLDKATKSAKALSIAILAIGSALTAMKIVKSVWKGADALRVVMGVHVWLPIALAIGAVVTVIIKLVQSISLLVENWKSLPTGTKVVSILLAVASAILVVAGAIMIAKNALIGNWIGVGLGALLAGAGVGAAFGTEAIVKSAVKKADETKTVPAAAHGAIVKSATVTMVGEGKYNEAIVPLGNSPEFTTMKQDITNAVLAGLGSTRTTGQPINVIVNVDKDYIYKSYNQVAKQNGVK